MTSSTTSDARPDRLRVRADLHDVAHQVHEEFDGMVQEQAIDECLTRMAAKFDDAKVRSFVPLLVRRYVRAELKGLLVPRQVERSGGDRS